MTANVYPKRPRAPNVQSASKGASKDTSKVPGNIAHTDIAQRFWLYALLPQGLHPYIQLARLDRPVGLWLLLFPSWCGIGLASAGQPDIILLLLFLLGALLLRPAGCIINDLWDRNIDRAVERTKARPLASGALTVTKALIFLLALLTAGAAILFSLTPTAIGLGLVALVLIVIYPLMKRISWWPQLFLGFTFNGGVLLGFAAVTNHLSIAAGIFYIGCIAWTTGYDTIYAGQDMTDDALIGVRSTTRRFGHNSPKFVGLCYSLAAAAWAYCGLLLNADWFYWFCLLIAIAHLGWQALGWRLDSQADCLRRFKSNIWVGLLLSAACLLGTLPP